MYAIVSLDLDTGASAVAAVFRFRVDALTAIDNLRAERIAAARERADGSRALSSVIHGIKVMH